MTALATCAIESRRSMEAEKSCGSRDDKLLLPFHHHAEIVPENGEHAFIKEA